jgi:hypothetical protein
LVLLFTVSLTAVDRGYTFLVMRVDRRARGLVAAVFLAALAAAFGTTRTTPFAQRAEPVCDIRTTERVVAVGDVHGAYSQFTSILRTAGLLDERERWIGGRAILVQTGDVLDRGPDSLKVLDLLRRLERDAQRAGGRVLFLLGNHEVMRMVGDWRYVSEGEFGAFRDGNSTELRQGIYEIQSMAAERLARKEGRKFDAADYKERFMREIPLGWLEMRAAFQGTSEWGKWLRTHPAIVKVNGVVYIHGGVHDDVSKLGCQAINETVAKDLAITAPTQEQLLKQLSSSENGPLWYRGLADEPEDKFTATLDGILKRLEARAIVVGHTPRLKGIMTRFEGRVVLIDTGMLGGTSYPGGVPSALELRGDAVTAIYMDRREPLRMPALEAGAVAATP